MNAISAVTSARKLYFRFKNDGSVDKGINALDVVAFIQNLLRHTRGPLVVVCDNARQHRNRAIKDLLRRRRRLKVVYLPGYSPDFNPDEGVWGWVKWGELGNFAARDEAELMAAARAALRRLQGRRGTIAGFWRHSQLPLDGITMLRNKPEND